jgi:hypothetical protein
MSVTQHEDAEDVYYMGLKEFEKQGKDFMNRIDKIEFQEYRETPDERFKRKTIQEVAGNRKGEFQRMIVNYPPWYMAQGEDYVTITKL